MCITKIKIKNFMTGPRVMYHGQVTVFVFSHKNLLPI